MKHLERTDHTEQEENRVKIRVFKNWKDLGENQESTQVRGWGSGSETIRYLPIK